MTKPKVLFHGTADKNIEIFEPKAITFRNKTEGPLVFATHSEIFASMFMVNTNDSWTDSGFINDIPYMMIADKDRFLGLDSGGAIYQIPADTFTNPGFRKGEKEWTSKVSVKPLEKKVYKNALDAMLDFGVQVFFVSLDKMNSFKSSKDISVIGSAKSENQKRNVNVQKFS